MAKKQPAPAPTTPTTETWNGPTSLRSLLVPIDTLTSDPRNARAHGERSYDAISASLRQFGQRKPIVVDGTKVIAGNGQLEAARRLGWTHLAVTTTEGLSSEQVRAYALADNRTAELSEWNLRELSAIGVDVMIDVGWTIEEIKDLLPVDVKILDKPTPSTLDKPSEGGSRIVHTCPRCQYEF